MRRTVDLGFSSTIGPVTQVQKKITRGAQGVTPTLTTLTQNEFSKITYILNYTTVWEYEQYEKKHFCMKGNKVHKNKIKQNSVSFTMFCQPVFISLICLFFHLPTAPPTWKVSSLVLCSGLTSKSVDPFLQQVFMKPRGQLLLVSFLYWCRNMTDSSNNPQRKYISTDLFLQVYFTDVKQ